MSDRWGPDDGDQSEWARPDAPPPAPGVPRMVEPPLTLETEGSVQTDRGFGGRVLAGVIGVLVLLGGLAFASTQLGSSGPGSAEDAVRELLAAASDEDALGVLAALDPGERDALRQPVEDLIGELQRLEVLAPGFDLGGVRGIDLEFADVQLRSEPVRDDLVRVYFTGGTVSGSVTGTEIPVGDFVRDTLDEFGVDLSDLDESQTDDIVDDDTFLAARRGDDGWRVSIGYTAAEAARINAGVPLPASGLAAIGADSPEGAVDGLVRAMAGLDLAGMIARLNPGEMRALQDYAPIFLERAEAALAEESEEIDISLDELSLSSETDGDRGSVFIDAFALTVTHQDESVSVSTDGECFTIEMEGFDPAEIENFPFGDGPVCAEDLENLSEEMNGFGGFGIEMPEFPPTETPEIGITTVRVDGQWYVSPFGTVLDGAVDGLAVLERAHLDAMVDFFDGFFGGAFFGPVETEFSEVGERLPEDGYEPTLPEDLEGFDEFSDEFSEEFPTTTALGGFGSADDYAALHSVALSVTGEDSTAKCTVLELFAAHDPHEAYLLRELVDSWQYDYQPSPEAQEALLAAADQCLSNEPGTAPR